MIDVWVLARKDLLLLLRDRAGFFFTFFWPVMMAMFFGSVFGGGPSPSGSQAIQLMVVDQDQSASSRRLLSSLEAADEVEVIPADLELAAASTRRGSVPAYLVVLRGFGKANENRFAGSPPRVELRSDPSRRAEAAMLEGILLRSGAVLLEEAFTDSVQVDRMVEQNLNRIESGPDFQGRERLTGFFRSLKGLSDSGLRLPGEGLGSDSSGSGALAPLIVERHDILITPTAPDRPQNPYAVSFAQAMLWAVLGCSASFGISLAVERTQGTLLRLRMSPLSIRSILGGKGVACFVTSLAVSSFLVLLAVAVFSVRPLSWPLLALALICTALCFVGVMMLLSVIGRTERAAAGIGWAILLVLSMFGGGMVPLFIMPEWMRALSDFSPVKWGILAIEGAVWRGFSAQEMILPCSILLAVGLATFLVGARLFKWGELG